MNSQPNNFTILKTSDYKETKESKQTLFMCLFCRSKFYGDNPPVSCVIGHYYDEGKYCKCGKNFATF